MREECEIEFGANMYALASHDFQKCFFRLASENEAKSRMYEKIIRIVYQVDVSSSELITISIIE